MVVGIKLLKFTCLLLLFITAYQAISDVFGSNNGNEGSSNVTVIITNTISALSTASANNTNTDSDTITNTLSGRSFSPISQDVYSLVSYAYYDLYRLIVSSLLT